MNAHSLPTVVIEANKSIFGLSLRDLWEFRELLFFLVWRDIKVRYAQTVIGVGWAVLQPLATMILFTVVFGRWGKIPSDGLPYPIFAYAALLPWNYMARSLERSSMSVVNESSLIQKVYFPRLIIPLAATGVGLVDFGIAFGVLLAMMGWYDIPLTWGMLMLPIFILLTFATALAVSLWLSALYVKYHDVGSAIPLLIQLWMFASPVVYPITLVPEQWRFLYSLNPMVGIIEGFRWALLGKASPDFAMMAGSAAVVGALMCGGVIYFKHMERTFADVI